MKKIIYTLMFLLFCYTINAQNIVDTNTNAITNYFQLEESNTLSLNDKAIIDFSILSNIDIIQKGDNNNINVVVSGNKKQKILQNGDYNNFEYYTYYNTETSSIDINQNGNDNSLQIFGQNNISQNLIITQNTNNQTIIIKNY